jgi:hypothetical protein
VCGDARAGGQQLLDEHERRALAQIVSLRLEGQPPHGHVQARERTELLGELLEHDVTLPRVGALHAGGHVQRHAVLLAGVQQRLHVLGEARPAVAGARKEERRADARVAADAAPHVVDVGADALAEQRDLVHERDARGEHRVGGVLGELRARHVHEQDRLAGAYEGRVQLAEHAARMIALDAEHDAVGVEEVLDRGALLEELGVAAHVGGVRRVRLHHVAHQGGGAHGDGALGDHDDLAPRVARDRLGGGEHVPQVGRAVLAGRGAHGEKHHRGLAGRRGDVGGEAQAALPLVAAHEVLEPRLEDRQHVALQQLDLAGVDVGAHDVVAGLGETGADDEAHVAGSDDEDLHEGRSVDGRRTAGSPRRRARTARIGELGPAPGDVPGNGPCNVRAAARRAVPPPGSRHDAPAPPCASDTGHGASGTAPRTPFARGLYRAADPPSLCAPPPRRPHGPRPRTPAHGLRSAS